MNFKSEKQAEIEELNSLTYSVQNEKKKLTNELKEFKAELQDKNETLEDFKHSIKDLSKKNQRLQSQLEDTQQYDDVHEELIYYKNQTKDLKSQLTDHKERISFLESTQKSTAMKQEMEEERNAQNSRMESSRLPTFSQNVFTQEEDEPKPVNAHRNTISITEDLQPDKLAYVDSRKPFSDEKILCDTSDDDDLLLDSEQKSLLEKYTLMNGNRTSNKLKQAEQDRQQMLAQ